uniref:Major facilitator superfamily (MFS) profile domain-containing protein n=1 Tax=Tetraodon nigroviridis TaxID=99883 RepID=H3DCZ1_TETNG
YDFDRVTSFLGDWGPFQRTVVLLLSLSTIPSGYLGMISVFISRTLDFRCKASVDPSNRSSAGTCSRYQVDGNWTQGPGLSNDTEPCLDGWDFGNDTHGSTIVTEWDLVCEDAWKVPFSTSLFFFGVMIGIFICGGLSDRFGRKPVLFIFLAVHGVTALVQAISVSWVMFCVLNWLKGASHSYSVSIILGSELLPKASRVVFSTLAICLGYCVGYMLLPLSAYFLRGWRMLLVVSAILSFLQMPTWWLIPESPRWLLHQGRVDEAELIIRNAARRNKVPAPEVIFRAVESFHHMDENSGEKRTYNYTDLVRTTNIRNITVLSSSIWMCITFVYYGLSLNTSNLNGNIYLNCFFSATIDTFTYVVLWLLADRVPRPALLSAAMMYSGFTLLILKLIPEDNLVALQVLSLVAKFGATGAFTFICLIVTELMPTVVRNMGVGVGATSGFLGTIIAPYILYTGIYMKSLPFLIFATVSIAAAFFGMLLPDTRNSKLPDLIREVKPIRG